MITVATAERIILSMPEAEKSQHHGHPDFRVKNKIFATLWPTESRAVLKIDPVNQGRLLKSEPAAFSTNAWSKYGCTNIHLQHIDAKLFQELVEDSWQAVAPKKLVLQQKES